MNREHLDELLIELLDVIDKQRESHKPNSDLSLHQWLGLINEEHLEMVQAINETVPFTKTEKAATYGGMPNVRAEALQMMALTIRMLLDHGWR